MRKAEKSCLYSYVGKYHFEHSVCLTKSFFTFLLCVSFIGDAFLNNSLTEARKSLNKNHHYSYPTTTLYHISEFRTFHHGAKYQISNRWLITEICRKRENTGNFICLCFLDSSLKPAFPLLVPWRSSHPETWSIAGLRVGENCEEDTVCNSDIKREEFYCELRALSV